MSLVILPTLALGQPENTCDDPEINQRWEQAVADQPQNRLVRKLSAKRDDLCKLVKSGRLDLKTARSIWEKTLTESFLERTQEQPRVQEKQERRGLLVLFANFIF
ncbi:MAG TPA: hypothetical protein PK708_08555 [Candidatus Competibacter sp.]|nr:hypothetical protein [Candidatus Competibacter sp.]